MTSKIHTANKSNKPLAAKYSPLQQEAITYGSKFVTTRERDDRGRGKKQGSQGRGRAGRKSAKRARTREGGGMGCGKKGAHRFLLVSLIGVLVWVAVWCWCNF